MPAHADPQRPDRRDRDEPDERHDPAEGYPARADDDSGAGAEDAADEARETPGMGA